MAYAQTVVFHRAKAGSAPTEWEDGAGFDSGDPAIGRKARLIVVDGATEAYDSIRWVGQLVTSFLSANDGPAELGPAEMDQWFGRMQQQWRDDTPAAFANFFEERKFREDGSFATLLGCDVTGLGGRNGRSAAQWRAVALGDAVLFHVRDGRLVAQFPALAAEDFGLDPDGVFTAESQRERMRDRLAFAAGDLVVGDRLYLATDALAAWIVKATTAAVSEADEVWSMLDAIAHPVTFDRWVAAELGNGRLKNDDVTLMRVQITGVPAGRLTVCEA